MPNWIKGTMKLRGKHEDIRRFLDNELEASSWCCEEIDTYVECDINDTFVEYTFKNEPHIKGTRRMFVTSSDLYMDKDNKGTVYLDIKQAWSFSARDGELDFWNNIAHKYNIDIKLYGIESGMEFCQEVIALKDSDMVINNVTQYEDWNWQCPFPGMGG